MLPRGLIVSCQVLPDESLHSSFIMLKMALAVYEGGAVGIRANIKEDTLAIKETVDLLVIGIVKCDYDHSNVFITATLKEVDEPIESQCEVIALDAALQQRPKETLDELVPYTRTHVLNVETMADIAIVEEAKNAARLGFDHIGTTLHGYTSYTQGQLLYRNDFQFLKDVLQSVDAKVIAEGNVIISDMYKCVMDSGVHCSVVGGTITRPKETTKRLAQITGDQMITIKNEMIITN